MSSKDLTPAHRETHHLLLRLLAETPAWELSGPGDLTVANFGPLLARAHARSNS
jgi:hypothetical protein